MGKATVSVILVRPGANRGCENFQPLLQDFGKYSPTRTAPPPIAFQSALGAILLASISAILFGAAIVAIMGSYRLILIISGAHLDRISDLVPRLVLWAHMDGG